MANARLQALGQTQGWRMEEDTVIGVRGGFAFTISAPSAFVATVVLPENRDGRELIREIRRERKRLGISAASVNKGKLVFTFKAIRGKADAFAPKMIELLEGIADCLLTLGIPHDHCALCGTGGATGLVLHEKYLVRAHGVCIESALSQLEEREKDQGPSRQYLRGFLGAVVGASVATIPWVVVSMLGYVSAYLAVLIAIGAHFGYKLFTGKRYGPLSRAIVSFASLIGLVLCNVFEYIAWYLILLEGDVGSLGDFMYFVYANMDTVVMGLFYTAIFGLIGIVIAWKLVPKNQAMAREYRAFETRQPSDIQNGM